MSTVADPLVPLLQDARSRLRACHDLPVEEGKQVFQGIVKDLVDARNRKLAGKAPQPDAREPSLRQLNALLSLVASVEFPLAGFHRDRIDEVAQALDRMTSPSEPR